MTLTLDEKFNLRDSFVELTSDRHIRMAAYPRDEWEINGGALLNYSQVLLQDAPPIASSYPGGLLGSAFINQMPQKKHQNALTRAKNIAEHWQKVEDHDYYKWLQSDINFVKAWDKFQKQKSARPKRDLVSALLINEFTDFKFLRLVALHLGFQIIADETGYKPAYPDSKKLDQAKGYIAKLQESFKGGIKINNILHQSQLERLLEQLLLEINRAPRKEKGTPNLENRKCLEAFSTGFLTCFGYISPTILNELAAMLGWPAEHTAIDRIVKKVKDKQAQLLAKKFNK